MTAGRRALILVVTLFLVTSQQAALLHAIAHLGEASSRSAGRWLTASATSTDRTTAADRCGDCLAYAQVATLAGSTVVARVPVIAPASGTALVSAPSASAFSLFAFLARAPPALL